MPMNRPHQPRGFTMIEVLVALVVLSVGLLGLAGMQLTGLRYNQGAYSRSQAALMANDIIDRMRANTDGLSAGAYDAAIDTTAAPGASAAGCLSAAGGCTPAELAAGDIYEWCQLFNATPPILPGASATMTKAGNVFTIVVTWPERDITKSLTMNVQP